MGDALLIRPLIQIGVHKCNTAENKAAKKKKVFHVKAL
jgi:hypothetical protein